MNNMNKKPVVIGIGELLWDILPSGKKRSPINFVYILLKLAPKLRHYSRRE